MECVNPQPPSMADTAFIIWAPRQAGKSWLMEQVKQEIPMITLFWDNLGYSHQSASSDL